MVQTYNSYISVKIFSCYMLWKHKSIYFSLFTQALPVIALFPYFRLHGLPDRVEDDAGQADDQANLVDCRQVGRLVDDC